MSRTDIAIFAQTVPDTLTSRELKDEYSISSGFGTACPTKDEAPQAGCFLATPTTASDHLGIGGTSTTPGHLVFQHGDGIKDYVYGGETTIDRWTWNHVVFVRERNKISVYLNGSAKPEIQRLGISPSPLRLNQFFFGGRNDNSDNWEGRLDETAVFDRALTAEELCRMK